MTFRASLACPRKLKIALPSVQQTILIAMMRVILKKVIRNLFDLIYYFDNFFSKKLQKLLKPKELPKQLELPK